MTKWLLVTALMGAAACATEPVADDDDDGDQEESLTTGSVSTATSGGGGMGTAGVGGAGGTGMGGNGTTTAGPGAGGGPPAGLFPGALVITEIMNNPAAVTDEFGEWFEIHNATDETLNLQGAVIRHQPQGAGTPHVIESPLMALPGAYLVLARNGDSSVNGGISADYVYGSDINLNNSSDYLSIETDDGVLVDETSWTEESGLDPDGASRTLDNAFTSAADNDDDAHYCEALTSIPSGDFGTPGAANDSCL